MEKSFWCLIDDVCKNGTWEDAPMTQYPLTITLDGKDEMIAQRDMSDADKTLGVFHCPAGGHEIHLQKLRDGIFEWLGHMKNGNLPPALVWLSYRCQLPKLGIGPSLKKPGRTQDGTRFRVPVLRRQVPGRNVPVYQCQ